jgi:hypothetical protein
MPPPFTAKATSKTPMEERWMRYVLKAECDRCGCEIFCSEENARDWVGCMIKDTDGSIDALRACLSDLCDYCEHMMTKDD